MVVSSRDSSVMLFLFTSLKTGTTRPFGVSTATPIRKQQNAEAEKRKLDVKFTPVVFIMKAVAAALEQMPRFNSSLSEDGQRLTLKKYINIGVAVDAERFQIGDIGFVEVRNVRDHHPVTAQVSARDFLDTTRSYPARRRSGLRERSG
jgi:hypothetical protein